MKSLLAAAALAALLCLPARADDPGSSGRSMPLPDGAAGIRLDDYYFDSALGKVVVPAGRTGLLDLLDPTTGTVEKIEGFAAPAPSSGMVSGGPTSADGGDGKIFVSDRTDRKIYVVDPGDRSIVATAELAGPPDYIRFVAPTREVWVTEPRNERIEAFSLGTGSAPVHAAFIGSQRGEYEALVVDAARGRAYSNQGTETTALDLKTRAPVAHWRNGCKGAEGLALDEKRGFLMVACREGRVNVLDVAKDGKRLGSVKAGAGVDIIAYSASNGKLYIPAAKAAKVTFATLDDKGRLRAGKTVPGIAGGHCAATDGASVFVCDGKAGALVRFED